MSDELKPVHGTEASVPIRRSRKPLGQGAENNEKRVTRLLELEAERRKLDEDAKALDAEQRDKRTQERQEAKRKQDAATQPHRLQGTSGEPLDTGETVVQLGLKDGSAPYAQRRHAEALAEKLGLPDSQIIEEENGFVVNTPESLVPEDHEPFMHCPAIAQDNAPPEEGQPQQANDEEE